MTRSPYVCICIQYEVCEALGRTRTYTCKHGGPPALRRTSRRRRRRGRPSPAAPHPDRPTRADRFAWRGSAPYARGACSGRPTWLGPGLSLGLGLELLLGLGLLLLGVGLLLLG